MKIRTIIPLSYFLVQSFLCLAQGESMVVSKSGIFIRDSASVKSNMRCSVKFGEMVELLYERSVQDTVNGMRGNWVKVKYNRCVGYVFDTYLGKFKKQDKNFPKNYPQYFKLDAVCGEEQYFNADFYWYGVFEREEVINITRVKVDFSVKSENKQDLEYDRYLRISINSKQEPLFLIGLPDSIPDYFYNKSELMAKNWYLKEGYRESQIFPGQRIDVSGTTAKPVDSYWLSAYGNVGDAEGMTGGLMNIKDYKVKFYQSKGGKTSQIDLFEGLERWSEDGLPRFKFIGDLNNDNIPDVLFFHLTGHASADTYLFMSGYSKTKILTKVVRNSWGNCY